MAHGEVKIALTQEDLVFIYILRYAVYIEEMGFPFPTADHEKKMLYDQYDKTAIQFFITDEKEEEAIGIYRLNLVDFNNIDSELENRYKLSYFENLGLNLTISSKLMIKKDCRNLCTVNQLTRAVFNYGVERNYLLNILDCSPDLVPFYERMGFRKYYKNFIDPVLGEKVPMVLFVEDLDYLLSVKSPLFRICNEFGVQKKDYSTWLECNKLKYEVYA
jgi:predicted GNAT family N-acyltransferase